MTKGSGRKSKAEAKVERFTWFCMVLVFAVIYMLPESTEGNNVPRWIVPFSGSVILLGSGMYQYMHHWRVSPITWMSGTFMVLLTAINLSVNENMDFYGVTLLTFAAVIGVGVLTGET